MKAKRVEKAASKIPAPGKRRPQGSRGKQQVPAEPPRVTRIVNQLAQDYPTAICALHHANAFQLLVATILSAQCTDERVNMVTRELFAQYGTPTALAAAPIQRIEQLVQSTGFFRNKARNIQAMSQKLVKEYGGEVPQTLEQLVDLPGVGRKTANVVMGTAFGIPTGVVVDTHVGRITRRLGLSQARDPVKVEQDLMRLLPREEWIDYSHRLIHHGRQVCKARKPLCDRCGLAADCPRVGVDS
jgi:endonuclease-3